MPCFALLTSAKAKIEARKAEKAAKATSTTNKSKAAKEVHRIKKEKGKFWGLLP